jgi:hypothetical protein
VSEPSPAKTESDKPDELAATLREVAAELRAIRTTLAQRSPAE